MTKLMLHPTRHNFHDTRPQLYKMPDIRSRGEGGGHGCTQKIDGFAKQKTSVKLNNLT